jgi:hypothetical protein
MVGRFSRGTRAITQKRQSAADVLYMVGHKLMSQQRYKDAGDVFRAFLIVLPTDERGWVALGLCHEALGQDVIARELYGTGRVMARPAGRCEVALARLLRRVGAPDAMIDAALERAHDIADETSDEELLAAVAWERRVAA